MRPSLWQYRGFVLDSVRRDFQARYRRSLLGSAWAIIHPLFMIGVYTLVFGRLMRAQLPGTNDTLAYAIFLCAGLMTWTLFTDVITRSLQMFIDHAALLKKARFPRTALPAIVLLSALLNFGIVFAVLVLFLLGTGRFPGWPLVAFLPLVLVQQAFAFGLGLTLGTINVFLRDTAHLAALLLMVWFWLTPIVYPAQILGDGVRQLLAINPLTGLITAYQHILLTGGWPEWPGILPSVVAAAIAVGLGMLTFRRLGAEMVDHL
jgi:lipopolysaccharide transport system permease protein